jgi:hypothetical protein
MSTTDLTLQLKLETGLAEKQVSEFSGKAAKSINQAADAGEKATTSFGGMNNKIKEAGGKIQQFGVAGVAHVRQLRDWFDKTKVAVAASAAVVGGTLIAIKQVGEAVNAAQAMSPVNNAAIEAANQSLGGTVDRLTLIQTLQKTNLSTDMFGDAAKAAAFMAKQLGFSKEHMLDAVHSGTLMEHQLQALGISSKHLDNEVAKIALSMGGVGGEVDDVTKANIRARVTIDAIRKASKDWTADTRQAGDAAGRALATLKNVSLELGKAIVPAMTGLIKSLINAVTWGKGVIDKMAAMNTKALADADRQLAEFRKLAAAEKAAKFARDNAGLIPMETTAKEAAASNKANAIAMKAAAALTAKAVATEKAKTNQLNAQKRLREELVRQALEERKQLQEQAKDLVRNFSEKIIQTIADQGGAFGGVASALTDIMEKSRSFGATAFGRRGMVAAAQVAAQYIGQQNVDLAHQIELRKTELGLSGKALSAAKLTAGWLQGGIKDSAEYLGNERAANEQLSVGLQLLQSQAKIAQLRTEENNAFKDIAQSQASAQGILNALIARQAEMKKRGNSDDKAALPLYGVLIDRLKGTVAQYRMIGEERAKILASARRHAEIEMQLEQTTKRQERQAALRSAREALTGVGASILNAQGRGDPRADLARAGESQQAALREEIAKLQAESRASIDKLTAGGLDGNSTQQVLLQLQHQKELIALKQAQIDKTRELTQVEIEGLTLAGQLRKQFAITSVQFAANMAAQMKTSFDGLVSGMGDAMGNVIASAIQGDKDAGANFGKSTLEALGNLAMQWGSFFALQGVGMLASYQPTGAAVLAAGVGLTALGGVLRGTAGLIGAQPKATGSGSAASPFRDRVPGTQPDKEKNVRETYVLINSVPWRKGSAEEFRDMRQWVQRGERMTGQPLRAGR